tara:strand:+ start:96 stop:293 length:198 start_codon:yes stop_codon:yes gene_type:complete
VSAEMSTPFCDIFVTIFPSIFSAKSQAKILTQKKIGAGQKLTNPDKIKSPFLVACYGVIAQRFSF